MKQLAIGIGWFLLGAVVLLGSPFRGGSLKSSDHVSAVVVHPPSETSVEPFVLGNGFPVPEVSTRPSAPPPDPRREMVRRIRRPAAHAQSVKEPRHPPRETARTADPEVETTPHRHIELSPTQLRAHVIQTP